MVVIQKRVLLWAIILSLFYPLLTWGQNKNPGFQELVQNFQFPPDDSRPWVYWFWLNSNVTKKGITADLEAMKRVGIGGVLIMDVDQGTPKSQITYMSPEWQTMFRFALKEAKRLGLEVNMNNDAGYSGSGGPWVPFDKAMQKVVVSEQHIQGGSLFHSTLIQPPSNGNYSDIAVLAVREKALQITHMIDVNPFWNFKTGGGEINKNQSSELKFPISLPPPSRSPVSITLQFKYPYLARMLELTAWNILTPMDGILESCDDGLHFKMVKNFKMNNGRNFIGFDKHIATWFKISWLTADSSQKKLTIEHLELHPRYRIEDISMKAVCWSDWISYRGIQSASPKAKAPLDAIINSDSVIDLTASMNQHGEISCQLPKGEWTILRFGHTYTGTTNYPAVEGGGGPECDKLDKDGIRIHFEGQMKKLAAISKEKGFESLVSTHIDSWEAGGQNWTPRMCEEFKKRRGYDPIPYLPIILGRVINNLQFSERFLWDMRTTISELMVENYIAEMQRLSHENGLKLSMESYTTIGSDLQAANYVDEPVSEFWTDKGEAFYPSNKLMASAAHINNRSIVSAESFTSRETEKWKLHPGLLKSIGDHAMSEGVNRFIIHRYAMQPWKDVRPGMAMGPWGVHYERTQTWWEFSKPWHTYIARCQYLLRQGTSTADILYLQPEEPLYRFDTLRVNGFDYDACSPESFFHFRVNDHNLELPHGSAYHLLVLKHVGKMTLPLLTFIREKIYQGAYVLGDPPATTPGLAGYPEADHQLQKLVEELWGNDSTVTERYLGKGKLYRNLSPEEVMLRIKVAPDFSSDKKVNWIHRKVGDADIYFVADDNRIEHTVNCSFRVSGKIPEWWDAETGATTPIQAYAIRGNFTDIPISFQPSGSGFVIFRSSPSTMKRILSVTKDGTLIYENGRGDSTLHETVNLVSGEIKKSGTYVVRHVGELTTTFIKTGTKPFSLDKHWVLNFTAIKQSTTPDALQSWSEHPEPDIRFYSGTAHYTNKFSVTLSDWKGKNVVLNLGDVRVMAKVVLNGKDLGILWKAPYQVKITDAIQEGNNTLEIAVVNLWPNRLVGDEYLPEDSERNADGTLKSWPSWLWQGKKSPAGRTTFTTWRLWKKEDTLLKSGLLGPVTIFAIEKL